jgi:hypothetical protein
MNKHVFEKIAKLEKTELSEVKVELALADDMKNALSFLNKAIEAINNSIKNYENAYKLMLTEKKGADSVLATQMKLINTVDAKAKELGINSNSIPNYNEINKTWQTLSDLIDKVNQY